MTLNVTKILFVMSAETNHTKHDWDTSVMSAETNHTKHDWDTSVMSAETNPHQA